MTRKIRPIRIEGNIAYVPLTRGYEAVIDAADVPLVERQNWYASVEKHTVYATRTQRFGTKWRFFRMHRVLMGDPPGMEIDHIDSDGLNNMRSNLRVATHAENQRNSRISPKNSSGFKGVSWHKKNRRWHAQISVDGKKLHLGYFDTPEEAHAAYVAASERLHGEFARAG
jgi:hypothetical protein